MKPTIKVSISGCAFSLEEDAYKALDSYLESLKGHFQGNSESAEILLDVENRISELLNMRLTGEHEAVSLEDVRYIINIMGNPKDFGDSGESEKMNETVKPPFGKRLYRDMDNSILGGVCSGFARYVNTDPVLVRVIYVLTILSTGFFYDRLCFYLILLYILLWIVMPKAKTVVQKLSMRGANPSIEDIENREYVPINRTRGSGLLKVLKIIFGIILGIIAFSSVISIVVIVGTYLGISVGVNGGFPGISSVLDAFGLNFVDFKISLLILMLLPLVVITYTSVKLLFQRRFKTRDAVIYGLAFLLWIGTACYMGGVGWKYGRMYEHKEFAIQNITVNTLSDTLYVRLDEDYAKAKTFDKGNMSGIRMFNTIGKNKSFFFVPDIKVKKDTSATAFNIQIEKYAFDETQELALNKAQNAVFDYTLRDSLLIIKPRTYNRRNIWDREWFEIEIIAPANKIVLLDVF